MDTRVRLGPDLYTLADDKSKKMTVQRRLRRNANCKKRSVPKMPVPAPGTAGNGGGGTMDSITLSPKPLEGCYVSNSVGDDKGSKEKDIIVGNSRIKQPSLIPEKVGLHIISYLILP